MEFNILPDTFEVLVFILPCSPLEIKSSDHNDKNFVSVVI